MKRDLRVKMGHGGTLDPLATGVLILGVGKGTKSLQNFLNCTKTYEAIVLFGASTDTYDRVGRIIKKSRYDEITRPLVEKALEGFRGRYKQMPPLYSALKMEGKPLYEYAREGKPIPREIATREVEVSELELVEWYEPGTHNHRWPTEEAQETEKNFANSVWRVAKRQVASEEEPMKLTPEQEEQETKALAEWETTKRKAEERVDELVYDEAHATKRRRMNQPAPMMSGALGELPTPPAGRGSNLIPPPPAPNTPPPWEGKGPPAAKIRMTVTSGFYVRSLCHDLGEKLGCGAMMAELCRSRQGEFVLDGPTCLDYYDLLKGEDVWGPKVDSMITLWMKKPAGSTQPEPHDIDKSILPSKELAQEETENLSTSKKEETEAGRATGDTTPIPTTEEPVEQAPIQGNDQRETSSMAPTDEEWNGFDDDPSKTEDNSATTEDNSAKTEDNSAKTEDGSTK
jgi:tRNA pseudouridine55 synthase